MATLDGYVYSPILFVIMIFSVGHNSASTEVPLFSSLLSLYIPRACLLVVDVDQRIPYTKIHTAGVTLP